MADPIDSFDKAQAFALTLPGTVATTSYRHPAVACEANGRTFLNVGHEADTSFVIHLDLATVEMLMATEPETYWQSSHYEGYPAVLVRFDSRDPDRVRQNIAKSRDYAAALKPARKRK